MDCSDTIAYEPDQFPPVGQLIAALMDGVSVLITAPTGTAALLEATVPVLTRARTRVLQPRSPRDLIAFMNMAPLPVLPLGKIGLQHGFAALNVLDRTCDRIVMLVDNAHLLSHEALHYIELALGSGPNLSVALAGQPELVDTLALDDFTGLRRRLSLHLVPRASQSPSSVAPSQNDPDLHRQSRRHVIAEQQAGRGVANKRSLFRSLSWVWGGLFGIACTGAIALQLLGPPTHTDRTAEVVPSPAQAANTQPNSSTPVTPAPDVAAVAAVEPATPSNTTSVSLQPEMVPLPKAVVQVGSNDDRSERPVHAVTIKPFLIARYATTVREWQRCVEANVCKLVPKGNPDEPVTNVSWDDAWQYIDWLSSMTGQRYRLPTEAEWEYAARAGTETRYSWGNALLPGKASCKGCGTPISLQSPPLVYAYPPNPFGLYGMGGGAAEWVADCWHRDYQQAPRNGSAAWDAPDCRTRVLRGGSWMDEASYLRVSSRESYDASVRYPTHGFRVALSE